MADPVIVVGGGVAGLVTARGLAIAGLPVLLLEASATLGGKVAQHTVGGILLDAGAESFATRGGTVAALAADLGLGDDIVTPNPVGAWLQPAAGAAKPLPKTGLLGIPATPMARDVIDVVGLSGAIRAQLDSLMTGLPASRLTTLGDVVRRRMGRRVLERLVAPIVMGIHSRHPDEVSIETVAPGLRSAMVRTGSLSRAVVSLRAASTAGSAVAGIRGGIYRLVEALEADLLRRGVEIRTNTRVDSVGTSAGMGGVVLADGESIRGSVILAAPRVGARMNGAAPTGDFTSTSEADHPEIVLATLVVDVPELDAAPRGTGVLVAPGASGITAKALTHSTSKWAWLRESSAGKHVLRLSYDGRRVPQTGLAEVARADAERLLGVSVPEAKVLDFASVGWSTASRASGAETVADHGVMEAGTVVVGESVAGVGLAAVIGDAQAKSESFLNRRHVLPD